MSVATLTPEQLSGVSNLTEEDITELYLELCEEKGRGFKTYVHKRANGGGDPTVWPIHDARNVWPIHDAGKVKHLDPM